MMMTVLTNPVMLMLASSDDVTARAADWEVAQAATGLGWAGLILLLPMLSLILCGLCAAFGIKNKAPAWITVTLFAGALATVLALCAQYEHPVTIKLFDWFNLAWGSGDDSRHFIANFSLYVDKLALLWMVFVTLLCMLIALYASEYMEGDLKRGYTRFFAGVSIFLFAMSCLVMGDNLLMLYLGWEGVGFASYWLIGYFYQKPSAVEAGKKAFIVNRIGDLGLALGVWLTWHAYGTVEFTVLFEILKGDAHAVSGAGGWSVTAIPYLFILGAVGKSAQMPLYVWLPDAMEGPTPVSALIHAATMVTAGVYLIARMLPLFMIDPVSLQVVAWIGGLTALLAATIGMAQYDIKRIMAYSTVSQLGYMFLGLGVMTSYGAAYHVFTHAFFKAVLFLTCGAIMHGFAGQLDLRKLSGLRHMPGWRIVSWTMFYGCLCLIGFPYISSGFYSKDMIMAQAFTTPGPGFVALGILALLTALLTSYYAFRVWFRVCAGPVNYEMGDEQHGHEDDDHAHDKPHAPRFAINFVLIAITLGAALAIIPHYTGWVKDAVAGSSAAQGVPVEHHAVDGGFFSDPHKWMPLVASLTTLLGLALAWYFHLARREAADSLRAKLLSNPATAWLPTAMENKWYVDEIYDAMLRQPLWVIGKILFGIDRGYDAGVVNGIGRTPRMFARAFQPLVNGQLQSYAVSMAGGVALVTILVVLFMPQLADLFDTWFGGVG